MSTRPLAPAAGHAKTTLWSPGVGMVMGGDQVLPSSVEELYLSTVSPVICPPPFTGACSQIAYRLPALSIPMVGKLPPALKLGKLATGRSTQLSPLGSLTFGVATPTKATGKQRPIRILLKDASSWMTFTCFTAVE